MTWRRLLEATKALDETNRGVVAVVGAAAIDKFGFGPPRDRVVDYQWFKQAGDPDTELGVWWLSRPHELASVENVDLAIYTLDWAQIHRAPDALRTIAESMPEAKRALAVVNFDGNWQFNDKAEYMQQYLRLFCLEHRCALVFSYAGFDWKAFVFGELGWADQVQPDIVDQIVVPSGWDSRDKIAATKESFPVGGTWAELDVPQLDQALNSLVLSPPVEPLEYDKVLSAVQTGVYPDVAANGSQLQDKDLSKIFNYLIDRANT